MTQQPWAERLAKMVAREVRRHRERRGLSAQDLADGCARMGMPIQRSVIANFENGRRASIGVAELLVFAAVLKIPPVWLITPMGFEPSMEILPGEEGDPYACATWIGGTNPREDDEEEAYSDNPSVLAEDLIFLLQQVEDCRSEADEARSRMEENAPEVALIDERLAALKAGYDEAAKRQEEILEKVKAMDPEERMSGETAKEFKDAEELLAKMTSWSQEMSVLSQRRVDAARAESDFKFSSDHLSEYEKSAREVIADIRGKGWLPPEFPAHLAYLLEEPKKERPSKPLGRRRKRAQ